MNLNTGKKPLIPINTSAAAGSAPAAPSAAVSKMTAQARESAKSASFSTISAPSPQKSRQGRGRRPSSRQKTIMKGVYFEPAVYNALLEMQDKGQNISKFVNRLVRQSLAI